MNVWQEIPSPIGQRKKQKCGCHCHVSTDDVVFVHWPGSNPTAPKIALAAEAAARVRERE